MALYERKVLSRIDAEQWFPGRRVRGVYEPIDDTVPYHHVRTIQCVIVQVTEGDWIIDEGDGKHFYPCADAVFRETYREVE